MQLKMFNDPVPNKEKNIFVRKRLLNNNWDYTKTKPAHQSNVMDHVSDTEFLEMLTIPAYKRRVI